jgi:predicted enzyme related to lactoylglutathione lyase
MKLRPVRPAPLPRPRSRGSALDTDRRFRSRRREQSLSPDYRVMALMEKSHVRIGSIVIDVKDFNRMMAFWQEALGYRSRAPPDPGDPFIILRDPSGKGPNVSLDGMPPERNRLHLDLYTDDQDGEVERLLRLGATRYRPREPGEDFVVLADPDGNLFCVVDTKGH